MVIALVFQKKRKVEAGSSLEGPHHAEGLGMGWHLNLIWSPTLALNTSSGSSPPLTFAGKGVHLTILFSSVDDLTDSGSRYESQQYSA